MPAALRESVSSLPTPATAQALAERKVLSIHEHMARSLPASGAVSPAAAAAPAVPAPVAPRDGAAVWQQRFGALHQDLRRDTAQLAADAIERTVSQGVTGTCQT